MSPQDTTKHPYTYRVRRPQVERVCQQCGVTFHLTQADIERGRGLFCSRQCKGMYSRRPLTERFWQNIDQTDGCWEWTGYRNPRGYGQMSVNEPRTMRVLTHRVAWELTYGPIPDGLEVCHTCDNPPCCNPAHLFLGTHDNNMKDAANKGRMTGFVGDPAHLPHGEQHHRAKLTDDDIRNMRAEYASGITRRAISRKYGISYHNTGLILKCRAWKHIK